MSVEAARRGEGRQGETWRGTALYVGSGQPHTLAVGAASFEFTAKYVAILCFARIWLRQAPLSPLPPHTHWKLV